MGGGGGGIVLSLFQVRRIKGGYGSWRVIANALPNRSMKCVKDHGMRLLDCMNADANHRWSSDDVKALKDLVKRLGPKWTVIGNMNSFCCDSN